MTTQTHSGTKQGLVQEIRKIRDQISEEIKDMTFEEERAYLDKLLAETKAHSAQHGFMDTVND